jgi:hypothetical protein
MTSRLAAWIVGALAVALVLPMLASYVGGVALLLAVPVAVVASILTRRHAEGHAERDVAERLVAAVAAVTGERTSPDDAEVDWGAALRAELASITVPRERRRFALGAAVALLGRPHRLRSPSSRPVWRSLSVRACWASHAPRWATTDSAR